MQSTNKVIIVRPHKFIPNPETEKDNNFQDIDASRALEKNTIEKRAYAEGTNVIQPLENNGIEVNRRSGCKLCKPWKINGYRTERMGGEKFSDHRHRLFFNLFDKPC